MGCGLMEEGRCEAGEVGQLEFGKFLSRDVEFYPHLSPKTGISIDLNLHLNPRLKRPTAYRCGA
ncbi:hypothetical protein V22_01360 [Calycomorphotria hydatis]|uniref:Uncharacterized protein n=1 Tax=Calycomorphotria hydatis TaxID=2528027 RepID=A0A517T3I1_9PLAN|nr:hypothetical protein V22_01360 [Calycomorphotria hydatis]